MDCEDLFNIIQANVLKAHNRNYSLFIFFTWKDDNCVDKDECQDWLKGIGKLVTSHATQLKDIEAYKKSGQQSFVVNLGLTFQAMHRLKKLQLSSDSEFTKGMNHIEKDATYFGPIYREKAKVKDEVDELLLQDNHHAVLCVAHDKRWELKAYLKTILLDTGYNKLLKQPPTSLIIKQQRYKKRRGENKGRVKGPFGIKDNISTIKRQEDILKHAFNYKPDYADKVLDFGTYMAIQKIQLHKKNFNKRAASLARKLRKHGRPKANAALGRALIIGRFNNGTPLATHQQPAILKEEEKNDFSYESDNLGSKCPLHAHIRSANPRVNANESIDVPIVRRSIVYQQKRGKSSEEALLFISFQASIERNLLPIYQRLLLGQDEKNPWRVDALIYPHKKWPLPVSEPNEYYPIYGTEDKKTALTYRRFGEELTTIVSGNFYYCPSKTFLDDPQ